MTFWRLSLLGILSKSWFVAKREWSSGQCISADENVKKNVVGPLTEIAAYRSSLTLCQDLGTVVLRIAFILFLVFLFLRA